MNKEKEDYKDYVYLRIPKTEYEKIIDGLICIDKSDIEAWRSDYELAQSLKKAYANRANKIRSRRLLDKIYKAVEDYYLGLFKPEKELTVYKLSKLAKIHYQTAVKYWDMLNMQSWIEKIKRDPTSNLPLFKVEINKLKDF